MKIRIDLDGVISDLKDLNVRQNKIYELIGVISVLASYRTRKEISPSKIYKVNLKELSDVALQKYKECLTSSLKKSIKIIESNNPQKRIKQFVSKLEQKVSKIEPECVSLDNLFNLLHYLESKLITYEEIGREIVNHDTLSKFNINIY